MKKSYVKKARDHGPGMRYKHDLGQHFLYDEALLGSLVEKTGVGSGDFVLEIGAGSGSLTRCLCKRARRVIAVEVDEAVMPYLKAATLAYDNVTIIEGDVRRLDLAEICRELGEGFFVIANIPYNITTPIFQIFLDGSLPVKQMCVMVQREVADKLLALPGDPGYGLLSFKCRYRCEPELLLEVPAECFTPPPKVDSAFVRLSFRREPLAVVRDEALMLSMVRAAFTFRRKTLANALKGLASVPADGLREALGALGLSPSVRGEALTIEQWAALANMLSDAKRPA